MKVVKVRKKSKKQIFSRSKKHRKTHKTRKIFKIHNKNKKYSKKNIYKHIIVGGGFSGLFLYYKLLKTKKINNRKSCLMEKSYELGGRVKTLKIKTPNKEYHNFESGAGRINKKHKNLMNLIKEFGMTDKLIKITGDTTFITKNKSLQKFKKTPYYYFKKLFDLTKDESPDTLRSMTFLELCKKKLGNEISHFLTKSYAYNDEFITNAYDALRLYKKSMNPHENEFFILKGGLSQLINELENRIKKMGGSIKKSCEVKDIRKHCSFSKHTVNKKIQNMFTLKIFNKNEKYDVCTESLYLALPKPALKTFKILNPAKKWINSVGQSSLNRIYAVFPPDNNGKFWFEGMGKMITDNELRFIIPINPRQGSIMISYGDEEYARYWGNQISKKDKSKWVGHVMEKTRHLFGESVPDPIWIESYFWKNGVSYCKKNANSAQVTAAMLQPLGDDTKLYVCGSNYSMTNAWIEGGLETTQSLLSLL